jgi:DNA-binding CsgD family transcriptional regulator
MGLLVAGQSSKEIARGLGISHRTVEIHRTRVMHKMRATNLIQLAAAAAACDTFPERGSRPAPTAPEPG